MAETRLDIRWLDAYNRLAAFLRDHRYDVEEAERRWGYLLYGEPIPIKRNGKIVRNDFSPADHPLSDLRDEELGERFIEYVDVYLDYCNKIVNPGNKV